MSQHFFHVSLRALTLAYSATAGSTYITPPFRQASILAFAPPRRAVAIGTALREQAAPYSFAGDRKVDMSVYNLPLETIESEWVANLVPKTVDSEGGVFLNAKNDREIFVDNFRVSFPRLAGEGMGIELAELAGGREDGLGITVVTGLVEGGVAAMVALTAVDERLAGTCETLMPGDSISEISVVRRRKSRLSQSDDISTVRTECLGYDATVDTILSLPPTADDGADESYEIVVKRLRRKPRVTVNLRFPPSQNQSDVTVTMFAGENLRLGMLVRGVKLNDPLAKRFDTKSGGNCGAGGLCRTCAVSVLRGGELLNPQKLAEKQMLEDSPRWRLTCKAFVGYGMAEGDITLQVSPNQW